MVVFRFNSRKNLGSILSFPDTACTLILTFEVEPKSQSTAERETDKFGRRIRQEHHCQTDCYSQVAPGYQLENLDWQFADTRLDTEESPD